MNTPKIYFDNNATTRIDPEIRTVFDHALDAYGNPSSMHMYGREAGVEVEKAREALAELIGADSGEIIFTGGGSESNNTVLKSLLHPDYPGTRRKLVVSSIEHPCVLETARFLERLGIPLSIVEVDSAGKLDLSQLERLVDEETALVSIMLANNEIGTIQDIAAVSQICRKAGALLHSDAVQAIGKIPVDVNDLGVDYLTVSGHKLYAPKGVGALYRKRKAPLFPLIHGGHQEEGLRAGTINAPAIIAFGAAARKAGEQLEEETLHLGSLRQRLKEGLLSSIDNIRINGHERDVLPGTLDVSFFGAEGESILLYLDLEGFAVSTGSACATGSLEPSHVLMATGVGAELAHGSIRFSFGRFNTDKEVDLLLEKLPPIIDRIRKMSTHGTKEVKR